MNQYNNSINSIAPRRQLPTASSGERSRGQRLAPLRPGRLIGRRAATNSKRHQ